MPQVYQWPMPLPEDAGRIRAAYAPYGQVHEFWDTYEEFFKPVTEDAVKSALADALDEDQDDAFRIPRLGPHWSESKGMMRDEPSPDMNDDDLPLKAAVNARVAGKRKGPEPMPDDSAPQTAEERLRSQKMTMRILACFMHQDGVASATDSSVLNDQGHAMKAVADATVQRNPGSEMLSLKIERRMRVELTNLGLMERPDLEYDQDHLREDDVVCAQLRFNQEALRKHGKERDIAQTGSRKRLRQCVDNGLQKEKLLTDVISSAKLVTDSLQPKFKYAKGIKPQDMKKSLETWDRAYSKFKSYLANPSKRKAVLGASTSGKKLMNEGKSSKSSGAGGARAGGPVAGGTWPGGGQLGGGNSTQPAKAMAVFHQNVHRK